jgi:hypothetical protein
MEESSPSSALDEVTGELDSLAANEFNAFSAGDTPAATFESLG